MNDSSAEFKPLLTAMLELAMSSYFRRLHAFARGHGLGFSQLATLFRLYHHGGCTVSDLSQQLDFSNAAASQLLDKLVQAGLVRRFELPDDRRGRNHCLTDQGTQLMLELKGSHRELLAALEASLDDRERQAATASLQTLVAHLDRLSGQRPDLFLNRHHGDGDCPSATYHPSVKE